MLYDVRRHSFPASYCTDFHALFAGFRGQGQNPSFFEKCFLKGGM